MKSSRVNGRGKQKNRQNVIGGRWLWQLFGCGLVLMTVLALRMFVPGFEGWLQETVHRQSAVQEVFSTLGEGLSGKRSWKDTWQKEAEMVFGAKDDEKSEMVFGEQSPQKGEALEKSSKDEEKAALSAPLIPAMEYTASTGQITPLSSREDALQNAVAAFTQAQTDVCATVPESVRYDAPPLPFYYVAPSGGVVTSAFGYRDQPGTGDMQFHHGTDFGGETGDPILAFADGTVSAVGEDEIFGKYIILQHEGATVTEYGHLSEFCVKTGDTVKAGQIIGKMGETGNATGPCLHFVLLQDGWYLNPAFYLL